MAGVARTALVITGVAAVAGATLAAIALRGHARREPAIRPYCHVGPTTPGIDVSYYQEAIDWPRVRQAGIRFAFIRLSDGATQRDSKFAANWSAAGRAGVLRGAYQFFRPDQSVAAQADLMIAALRGKERADLPPALDVEVEAGLSAATVAERARAWVDRVRDALDVEPIVYTGGDLWRAGGATPIADQPLWIAHYTPACPSVPAAWSGWMFWQHTDHGAIPGIDGPVDLDLFAGAPGDLPTAR
jgi:lysozyme